MLEWIPYYRLESVEYLKKGGFSTVYQAIWLDINKKVALKSLDVLNENLDEFLNEVC